MRDRDWANLLWNVRRGRSVLFTGPDLGAGVETGTAALARHLADLLREEHRTVMGQGLPAVAQQFEDDSQFGRSDLEREVARYYENCQPSGDDDAVETRIASLPFPLVITSSHATRLAEALRASGKRVDGERYHFRGENPPVPFANNADAPLVYYLHGVIGEPASLVLTDRDLLQLLERILAQRPGLPDAIGAHLQKRDTTFLFLGFGLRHEYLRVLLHALRINRDDRSLAVEEGAPHAGPPDDTVLFYESGKITLYDEPVAAFVDELVRRFQESGGAISGAQASQMTTRPRVFISYANEDASRARRLFDGLEQSGFDTWLDKVRLEAGDRWDPAIEQEIARSDYILVLQSRALARKVDSYVNREIGLALERARNVRAPFKCVIPLQIEPCETVQGLGSYQTEPLGLGAESYEEALRKLVSLIRRDYQLRQRERVS